MVIAVSPLTAVQVLDMGNMLIRRLSRLPSAFNLLPLLAIYAHRLLEASTFFSSSLMVVGECQVSVSLSNVCLCIDPAGDKGKRT